MRWQFYTQQMMYAHIAEAIRESDNPDRHPTEFLNFFCLANRESEEGSTASGGEPTEPTLAREIKLYKVRDWFLCCWQKGCERSSDGM